MEATHSVLLYGAEIWADVLGPEVHCKRLAQAQRRGALRVAPAYRTVSEPAVMLIAGVIPVSLLAKKRKAIYRRKGENLIEGVKNVNAPLSSGNSLGKMSQRANELRSSSTI